MILRNATIKYSDTDPDKLSKGSAKRICVSCDICGRVRWVTYYAYRNLCLSCARSGKNNPFYGKQHSKESKEKMKENHADFKGENHPMYGVHRYSKDNPNYGNHKLAGENNPNYGKFGASSPNWQGGLNRSHVLPEAQCRKINTRFKGSEFHHLSKSIGIYIPKELHRHVSHNLKSGKEMDEMSILSFQFIKGEL